MSRVILDVLELHWMRDMDSYDRSIAYEGKLLGKTKKGGSGQCLGGIQGTPVAKNPNRAP